MNQQVYLCRKWLRLQKQTKNVNKRHSSYGYKHIVEKWAGDYISNDAFIEAVKKENIKYEQIPTSPQNIWVALSERTIEKYRDHNFRMSKYGLIYTKRKIMEKDLEENNFDLEEIL